MRACAGTEISAPDGPRRALRNESTAMQRHVAQLCDDVAPQVPVEKDAVHEEGNRPRAVLDVRDGAGGGLGRPAPCSEFLDCHVVLHSLGM
jgi:hypothetical protein